MIVFSLQSTVYVATSIASIEFDEDDLVVTVTLNNAEGTQFTHDYEDKESAEKDLKQAISAIQVA